MISLKLHCVFNMQHRCFVFAVGDKTIHIHPDQMAGVIARARDYKSARKENGTYDFTIEVPTEFLVAGPRGFENCFKYRFTNVSDSFCKQVIEYLDRVYTGWKKMWFGDDGQNKLRCLPCE